MQEGKQEITKVISLVKIVKDVSSLKEEPNKPRQRIQVAMHFIQFLYNIWT